MSVRVVERDGTALFQPDRVRQEQAMFTMADIISLPPDSPRVELVNGAMQVVPSPSEYHQDVSFLLCAWLRTHAPRSYKAVEAIGVTVAANHTLEPDVVLRHAGGDANRHFFDANQVVLAVEIVSRYTRTRDRVTKPTEYAQAGIPYFWRVEQHPVHVYAYCLAADHTYTLVADSAMLLELSEPFAIKLNITDITP